MQNVVSSSKALREQASTNYHHQQAHRRAQNSDDYGSLEYGESSNDGLNGAQYAPYYSQGAGSAGGGGLTPSPFAPGTSMNAEDQSFDYLLSPALAPVGPISSIGASSAGVSGTPLAGVQHAPNSGAQLHVHPPQPPPSQPIPPLPHSSSSNFLPAAPSARPIFGRSQTAIPSSSSTSHSMIASSSGQGRMYNAGHPGTTSGAGAGAYGQRSGWTETTSDRHQPLSTSTSQNAASASSGHAGRSSGQGSQPSRDYTPPPPISASALLEMVLKMRGDASPANASSSSLQGGASMSMARSQSANAAPPGAGGHLAGRSGLPPSALSGSVSGLSSSVSHNRNTSTGSNRSEDDSTATMQHSYGGGGGLQPPPSLARTISSKNVNENSTTPPGSGLETVVLSHQRVADVPDEVIEVLAGTVGRYVVSFERSRLDRRGIVY